MDRWKPYLTWLSEHEKMIKAAAIVFVLIVAVVFFGSFGEKSDNSISLQEPQDQQTETGAEGQNTAEGETAASMGPVYVDIGGCVKRPGVYQVVEGTRLFEVIKEAGGLTSDADVSQINQAETVTDGQKVVIPAIGEETAGGQGGTNTDGGSAGSAEGSGGITADGKVNINKADSVQLQELPGVGPATAEKILAYREAYGAFKAPEDIKNVSGIGDKTYEKMKDKICV